MKPEYILIALAVIAAIVALTRYGAIT